MAALPFVVLLGATPAEAEGTVAGASLGVMLPSNQLTGRDDFLGAGLLPGPSVGGHLRHAPEETGAFGWDASVELALFQSDSDARLRMLYVPAELGFLLGVSTVQDVALELRVGAGGALVSGGLGSRHETVGLGLTSVGGQIAHAIHSLSVVLGVGAGVLWQKHPQPVFQIRLALLTR